MELVIILINVVPHLKLVSQEMLLDIKMHTMAMVTWEQLSLHLLKARAQTDIVEICGGSIFKVNLSLPSKRIRSITYLFTYL